MFHSSRKDLSPHEYDWYLLEAPAVPLTALSAGGVNPIVQSETKPGDIPSTLEGTPTTRRGSGAEAANFKQASPSTLAISLLTCEPRNTFLFHLFAHIRQSRYLGLQAETLSVLVRGMIDATRRWLRRNRTGFAIGFGVIGIGYIAGQYVLSKITEARERMAGDRVAKEKCASQFCNV